MKKLNNHKKSLLSNLFFRFGEKSQDAIYPKKKFQNIITREQARSDPNGHKFSVVSFEVNEDENTQNLIKLLEQEIRITDELGWLSSNSIGDISQTSNSHATNAESKSLLTQIPPDDPFWKRALDIVGAGVGLVVLSPILLLITAVIKIVSPGPCFF